MSEGPLRGPRVGGVSVDIDYYPLTTTSQKMEQLGNEIVRDVGVQALSVISRLKERDSLHDNLRRPNRDYSELEDVTDIAGVRITTYFADDVDKIAKRIASEFDVDWPNSTNKRKVLDPDCFGYLSWHHVVSLGSNRASLPEYSQFGGLKAEIQTRSISTSTSGICMCSIAQIIHTKRLIKVRAHFECTAEEHREFHRLLKKDICSAPRCFASTSRPRLFWHGVDRMH